MKWNESEAIKGNHLRAILTINRFLNKTESWVFQNICYEVLFYWIKRHKFLSYGTCIWVIDISQTTTQ